MKVTVQSGDTLIQLTRKTLAGSGAGSANESFKSLMNRISIVAQQNQIDNPDLIFPGQVINFAPILGRSASAPADSRQPALMPVSSAVHVNVPDQRLRTERISDAPATETQHRVLERTLERAVSKGYIPSQDLPEVRRRILDISKEHRFLPDDFARVALIESDGLNPKASNGSCHGIIQFCNGPDRGAASVGFGKNPEQILKMSVFDQLDLVDRYFEDTQLKSYMPASLESLYLTVLYPAARDERQMHRALPIPGPQASVLHVGGQQNNPITKASLRKGLIENASLRLSQFVLQQARDPVAKAPETNDGVSLQKVGLNSLLPTGKTETTSQVLAFRQSM
ncbi:MAG: LysM peptidoglycan-binding domain-containing protein [Burkholderiaceae bacterium]|nr:LysM peptidoglycan-binding domain-containing protein [Burkholderiaceae bacterium]